MVCCLARRSVLVIATLLFAASQTWIASVLGWKLGADVLRLQTSFHVDTFISIIHPWSDAEHAAFVHHFAVDFVLHPICWALVLLAWLFNETRHRSGEPPRRGDDGPQSCCTCSFEACCCAGAYRSQTALLSWALLIVCGAGADVVENAIHLGLTQRVPGLRAPTTPLVVAASTCACAKWAIVLTTVAMLSAALLERQCCRLRRLPPTLLDKDHAQ